MNTDENLIQQISFQFKFPTKKGRKKKVHSWSEIRSQKY